VHFLSLIEAKRDGRALSPDQIQEMIRAYTERKVPDYQMAALLMAVFFSGLDKSETRALTLAMRDSGDKLVFPKDKRPLVDKHSTGGVGDKVSLPLAPLLACLGFRVPMISGRGLGITGGTLDKLDSIPGFKTTLPPNEIIKIVQRVGCVICGQTERMVPADKALYSLRDVTGTVANIPLIVASILSKKLAEGLQSLVLDVKFGAAAFMPTLPKARELATAMVQLGNACGVRTRALLTRMDFPLGRAAGNWLEVKEAIDCLEGTGPADLFYLVLECAAQLLVSTGKCKTIAEGRDRAAACLATGQPRRKWTEMLKAQGADINAFETKLRRVDSEVTTTEIKARTAGKVSRCDARVIGEVVRDLGGGRQSKDSVLNYEVGVEILAPPGSVVRRGEVLSRILASTVQEGRAAAQRVTDAFTISSRLMPLPRLVAGTVY
jgi:pyrimidine-nucleoside phosphorylase